MHEVEQTPHFPVPLIWPPKNTTHRHFIPFHFKLVLFSILNMHLFQLKMKKYTEEDKQDALDAIANGLSKYQAAKE